MNRTGVTQTSAVPARSELNTFLHLLSRYMKPYRVQLSMLLVGTMVATAVSGALPLTMAPILDTILGKAGRFNETVSAVAVANINLKNLGPTILDWLGFGQISDKFTLVLLLCGLFIFLSILSKGMTLGTKLLSLWIQLRSARDMQHNLYGHLLFLPLGFHTANRSGELISRVEKDTEASTGSLSAIIRALISGPILLLLYGTLLVRTNLDLSLVLVSAAVLHYLVTKVLARPTQKYAKAQLTAMADVTAALQETVQNIRIVKSFAAERRETENLWGLVRNVTRINLRNAVLKHSQEPMRGAVSYVATVAILLFASYEFLGGRLELVTFFLFLYVGHQVFVPITELGRAFVLIRGTLGAAERVMRLFDERSTVTDGPVEVEGFEERIRVENLSFDYGAAGGRARVLHDVSLEIRKGEVVALVGPSGAGKSTLVDMILRFYDPTGGRIAIDGRDLRTLKQFSYRRLFGVVPQEALLFNASVRDNIAYGREGITETDIVRAAKIANAHDFIMALPEGYDTRVGDRGIRLSGGQRQRVAIARAVAAHPPILLLDEATSALDSESERQVQEAIDRVIRGSTAIVIAHRLSTVAHADKIVVMDEGRIEAIGTHKDLLRTSPTYRKLHQIQFQAA